MEAARYANSLLPCVVVMPKFVRKQNVLYNSVRTLRKNWENSNYNNACRQWSTELGNRFGLILNTDGNPLIATPENCNLPINCNFFLQPNQAYYKGG